MDTRLGALIVVLLAVQAGPKGPALLGVQAEERFRITPDASGEVSFFLADAVDKSGYRPGDSDLMVWALQEWQRRVETIRFEMLNELRYGKQPDGRTRRASVKPGLDRIQVHARPQED